MRRYEFREIESKWRSKWMENPVQDLEGDTDKPKFYCLDMFPYPSGIGLHVGHWRGYVLSDVLSRYKMLRGFRVLHPMGWDAFGLPAENYAIKVGLHPSVTTMQNISTMKRQLQDISAVYDWNREIDTTDPGYYRFTQWIFVKMFKEGLAYEKEMPLNWCPKCKTVLANEEAKEGRCERCHTEVSKKMLRQWMLRITAYADRLLEGLGGLEWPEKVKKMQSDWIGKSYGAEIDFAVRGGEQKIKVFTTRPDTLYGATFMVLSPEHPLVPGLTCPGAKDEMDGYVLKAGARSSIDRMAAKDKTGVFTGSYAINPLNGESLQIWVSDYVLSDYGTGAIMCVPAHDERDFEFAVKFGLPVVEVISRDGSVCLKMEEAYTGEGVMVNSGGFDGMPSADAMLAVAEHLEEKGLGKKTVNYKLRDWVFSRQRYWGEPIPIIHCESCGPVAVPEDALPVRLPEVKNYLPTETGESPLAAMEGWVSTVCPECGKPAKRETNTMPTWAGSSWYFLRYADPRNDNELAGAGALRKWLPVDYYVGGVEHAVLHLLYARFYTKFLYDIKAVDFEEPFIKLFSQGMVNRFGRKMDKSGDNGVSPDEIISRYGCDSLRMYELFIGPPELDSEWDDSGIDGVYRFLNRFWKYALECAGKPSKPTKETERLRHAMIRDITNRIESLSLNTVVSGFMEYTNKFADLLKEGVADGEALRDMIVLIAPFAPHIAEELWETLGHRRSVFKEKWPEYDEGKTRADTVNIALQINGKLRDTLAVPAGSGRDRVISLAEEKLGARLSGQRLKDIYVEGRIVNFVVKN